jgi:flagellar M-ring protein FliF
VETFSSAVGSLKRLTVAVLVNERTGADARALTADELARVEALVANAVGLDRERGDAISVVNIPFETVAPLVPPETTGPGIVQRVQPWFRPMLAVATLLMATLVAFRALKLLRPIAVPVSAGALSAGMQSDALPSSEQRARFANVPPAAVIDDPEIAARMMKAWIREA